MKKITKIIASILFALGLATFVAAPSYAATDVCSSSANAAVKEAAGCSGTKDGLPKAIEKIVNAIILVLGIVAVIFVIIGGVQYMTSSGDSGKTEKAKKTIIYALIGLVICALSYAIVNWVIGIL